MKKVALSLVVIIGFIGYAYYGKVAKSAPTGNTVGQYNVNNKMNADITKPSSTLSIPAPTVSEKTTSQSQTAIFPYKNGSYVGSVADAVYGNIQVKVIISNGKIANVAFLQFPNDQDTSQQINQQADPQLAQEAIQAQSANVDIVSGATQSSQAFIQSMQGALAKAKS